MNTRGALSFNQTPERSVFTGNSKWDGTCRFRRNKIVEYSLVRHILRLNKYAKVRNLAEFKQPPR